MFTSYTPPAPPRKDGYALLLAVIALGILVSLSLAASYVSLQEVRKTGNFTRDTQALWNAQSGLAFMSYTLQNIEPARAGDPFLHTAPATSTSTGRPTWATPTPPTISASGSPRTPTFTRSSSTPRRTRTARSTPRTRT